MNQLSTTVLLCTCSNFTYLTVLVVVAVALDPFGFFNDEEVVESVSDLLPSGGRLTDKAIGLGASGRVVAVEGCGGDHGSVEEGGGKYGIEAEAMSHGDDDGGNWGDNVPFIPRGSHRC
ncbi:hypothetical protein PIB30_072179 [Stylosanthes scabra]|uniref:Uncharacterized protein n=1 Tax=Stylosanthes scabra TaxID=79078 RepID=A0ABU6RP00_9FABA|nr:hypothetical protein [Stylosanthes scabra]